MFRGRQQLERRDRESGRVFGWRVPVAQVGPWVLAVVLVGVAALGLAMSVRVTVGPGSTREPEPASLVVVPGSVAGEVLLLQRAIEAGPFPSRWNPAADPAYVELRRRALRQARAEGVAFDPDLVPLPAGRPGGWHSTPEFSGGMLPRLPEVDGPAAPGGAREVLLGLRVLDGAAGALSHEPLTMSAASARELVGGRYLLAYDREGRVGEVVALSRSRSAQMVEWISQGRVADPAGRPGWMSLEIEMAADD